MTTYYKWLKVDRSSPLGKGKWTPGRWRSVHGKLVPCKNGLHLCRAKDLIYHISETLWIAEIDPLEIVEYVDKVVVRRARAVEQIKTINDCTLRLFACDCANRVKHLLTDRRSLNAIEVARRFAKDKATKEELDAAWDAAWDAALAPALAAARAAALAAALAAARAAARAAAGTAVWDAQSRRLLQYVQYGEAAEIMPWESAHE